MTHRKTLIPVFAAVMATVVLMGTANVVQAQINPNNLSDLTQMIAKKFNLDQKQVQTTVDQFHWQKKADRMDNLVKQGKITESQKKAILEKQKELESWAKSQNIDLSLIMPFGRGGMMRRNWK